MKEHEIFKAIKSGKYKQIEKILKTGLKIDEIFNRHGQNPLHHAIFNNDLQSVELLLEYGVDIETREQSFGSPYKNYTPLLIAARIGNTEIAKLLIEKGADINKKPDGRNTLHIACIGGSEWLVRYLLKSGFDVNALTDYKSTPLHLAALNLNLEVIKILIEEGALINAQDDYKSTPLHHAAGTLQRKEKPDEHFKTIEFLVQNGADLYIKNENGYIPAENAFDIGTQIFIGELAAKQKGDPIGEWLSKAVDFFRGMGFFEKYKHLSKKDFINKIYKLMEDSPWMFSPNRNEADLPLLFLDKDRVYNCPMMGDANLDYAVFEKAKRYKEFVQDLNPIGRNIVKFENIKEKWLSNEGPIEVSFKYKGKIHTISQDYFGDYFDYSFINQINKIIQDSGYFFDLYDPYDMVEWGGFITLMNSEEKEKLIKERNWKFYSEDGFKSVRKEIEEVYLERVCEKWANKAFDYEKEGKYEEAFKFYAKVLKYETDIALDPDIWCDAGHMLTLLGRNEESKQYLNKAIEIYNEILKDHTKGAGRWFKMAYTYALLKNKDKALEALKVAIQMDSKFKNKAKEEEAFEFIKDDKDFINLIK